MADEDFVSVSAGVGAAPVHPLAVEVMKEVGIDITTQHSKETGEALKERFTSVVSVCDPSKERNPIFPPAFRIVRWNVEDAEAGDGAAKGHSGAFGAYATRSSRVSASL